MIDKTSSLEQREQLKKALLKKRLRGETLGNNIKQNPESNVRQTLPNLVTDTDGRYNPFPLTDVQQAYWIGRSKNLELGNSAAHIYAEFTCIDLNLEQFTQAWQKLILRHEMLRAIVLPSGQQQILDRVPLYEIEVVELQEKTLPDKELQLKLLRDRLSHQILPADRWPLFEICAARLDERTIVICFSLDLIIADALSFEIILSELSEIYQNPHLNLPPIELSFRDCVLALKSLENTAAYQHSLEYWQKRAATMPAAPDLPLAQNPAQIETPRFTRRRTRLAASDWQQLKTRANQAGLTFSGVLLAAYAEVLAVWSKNPRFTINLTLFNRPPVHSQINEIVGDFTSLTLLAVDNSAPDTFERRAKRIQAQLWEDLEHRSVSGIQVLRELQKIQNGISQTPATVVFTSTVDVDSSVQKNLKSGFGEFTYGITQTPQIWLDHQVVEESGSLVFNWDAVEELFPEGLLNDMIESHICFLKQLANDGEVWHKTQRQLLPKAQLNQRSTVNATNAPVSEELLHALFEKQVKSRSRAPAVVASDRSLSYLELWKLSHLIARQLRQFNVHSNELVAIVADKGWEQIVAALGILISGAAYVPIDPQLPQERRRHLLEQAEVKLVITQSHLNENEEWPENVLRICADTLQITNVEIFDERNCLNPLQHPEDLAYVIYTSGSTGVPKGVAITHRGAVNTILDINQRFHVGSTDRVLALSSLSFDLSVYDIFGTLAAGGTIIVPDADRAKDPAHWAELVAKEQVTIWNSVPALMQLLVDYAQERTQFLPQSLRLILLSGDWLPLTLPERIKSLLPATQIISLGGATEASIWSIIYPIQQVEPHWKSIPYGQPMLNQQFHVFSESLEPCPVWVPGQLYIGGIGLASCYWKNPEKTAASFMIHPVTGERLYKTGDLGRYLPDGNIEFLGREDFQVKVQGYRIELGEIEAALLENSHVRSTVVTAIGKQESKRLIAYIAGDLKLLTAEELRRILSKKLPEYMIPSHFVFLDALPLTANGKIDRRSLPSPDNSEFDSTKVYIAPRNKTEQLLAEIWSEVLGSDRQQQLSINNNFFELGGNSLLAIQLMLKLRETFQIEIPLDRLLRASTIAQLAPTIDELTTIKTQQAETLETVSELPVLVPDPEKRYEAFPLTDVQQAYWIGRSEAFDLGNVAAHVYAEFDNENWDVDRFTKAWQKLIDRHETLRAIIRPDGQMQILEEVPPYEVKILDLRGQDSETIAQQLGAIRNRLSHQILPADRWPLFEIYAAQLLDRHFRIYFSLDLTIADAWSAEIITKELAYFYENPEGILPPLELSFRDYATAVHNFKQSETYQRSLEYWQRRLQDLPPAPDLPLAKNPQSLTRPKFVRKSSTLEPQTWQRLKARAARSDLTPSGILLAAYTEVLKTWSKNPQFTINLTLFNRLPLHPQVNDILGDFTSLTLLEINSSPGESFEVKGQRIQQQLWQDLEHRCVSGVRVLRELARIEGKPVSMPVVFTSTIAVDTNQNEETVAGFGTVTYLLTQTPQVWLDHQVFEGEGTLIFHWDALAEIFPDGLLDDMFEAYCNLLQRLANEEEVWLSTTSELIPKAQIEQRIAINATETPISEELLHTLFEKQVRSQPHHPAIVAAANGSSSPTIFTYLELYRCSHQIARWLRQLGANPNQLVAVVMEKGWEQVVAALGILIAGAAYVPIDPQLPQERRWHLLKEGEIQLVVTQSWLNNTLDWPPNIRLLCTDTFLTVDLDCEPFEVVQKPDDLAYVIYTSGSTGVPKGVAITHRGAVNTILDINQRFHVGSTDRVLALSSLSFDLSVYDIFGTLAAGGTIIVPDADRAKDPAHWYELVVQKQVTIWNSVPALMQLLVDYTSERIQFLPQSLRLILLSGDWLPLTLPERIKSLLPATQIISLGGATEASIWSIIYPIQQVEPHWKSIPYGQPMLNQQFHVLNEQFEPCPVWVSGQLYIGGIGLASCYWKNPEKTAASFMIHPVTGERLYKTGDLGRYLPDGNIEFLGREDFQVKVQGYRIELGEIEAAIEQHPKVRSAVVAALGEQQHSKQLAACIVADRQSISAEELRQFLQQKLPDYMIPLSWSFVESLPLTANGKIDRRSLAISQSIELASEREATNTFIPPQTPTEKLLAQIWAEVLKKSSIGIHSNFFDLGGDSLSAISMTYKAQQAGLNLNQRQIFQLPTIAELAALLVPETQLSVIVGTGESTSDRLQSCLVAINSGGSKAPLFCMHPATGGIDAFMQLSKYLGSDRPLYGLRSKGMDGILKPLTKISEMAAEYLEAIRTIQPDGAYHLCGWSMGGFVAWEMAQQLIKDSRKVGLLALLDTPAQDWQNYLKDISDAELVAGILGERIFAQSVGSSNFHLSRAQLRQLSPETGVQYVLQEAKNAGIIADDLAATQIETYLNITKNNVQAMQEYSIEEYPGKIILFKATEQTGEFFPASSKPDLGWNIYVRQHKLEVHEVPGHHFSMLKPPNVAVLAEKLQHYLT